VYRCYIVWDSQWNVLVHPVLIYLASSGKDVICGVYLVEQLMVKSSSCFTVTAIITTAEVALQVPYLLSLHHIVAHLVELWVSLSVSLNVIVTSIICFRLLRMRALTREVLSPEISSMYTSTATMLIESAAPFSILGIGLVITGVQHEPLFYAFLSIWSMFCVESSRILPILNTTNVKSDFCLLQISPFLHR
jgi:hypothetical protein